MPDLINLTCPSCGGKLQITNDVERFSCGYCGSEQIVRRGGGIITLAPVVEGLKDVKAGVDKTASELAIRRLEGEIASLLGQRAAVADYPGCLMALWFGGFILAVSWLLSGALFGSNETTSIFLVLTLGTFGLAWWWHRSTNKQIRTNVAPIDQAIAERNEEIKKHQAIVKEI